mgnify:CR=1 FL=1
MQRAAPVGIRRSIGRWHGLRRSSFVAAAEAGEEPPREVAEDYAESVKDYAESTAYPCGGREHAVFQRS